MGYIVLVASIGALLWHAVVFNILWGWFFVPIFNLPNLSFAEAIGIVCIVALFSHGYLKKEEEEEKATMSRIQQAFFMPLISLAVGAIARLFM